MQTFDRIIFEELNPGFFSAGEILVSRAPGRIDLMGGIADYSGSLVLQWPIAAATHVAIQHQEVPAIEICSVPSHPEDRVRACAIPLKDLEAGVESVRAKFASDPALHWAAYVAGAFTVLDRGLKSGAKILISSAVPEGKGVSSSAALEVAAMTAIAAAYDLQITPQEIAFLSQRVENTIAGAPCGVMDQMTSACGERDRLLAILCQPGELQGTISLPNELAIWGIDSGIRHSVAGAGYGTVRTAAFMGYRIIAEVAGLPVHETATRGRVQIDDPDWNGYLANITPAEFENRFEAHLPLQMTGAEFLDRYRGITDCVTSVNPDQSYPVFAATKHPVYENARVIRFAEILMNWEGRKQQADTLGELMYQSHLSYSTCGLGSDGTDVLVRLAQEENDVYGAKITGGGSGGTVAMLALKSAQAAIDRIAETYKQRTGYQPTIISGSSDGAGKFGTRRL
ncbi:MAG TPA: galactokinase family protein [Pyrinomonadaceae bacterium]|jgi:L-arabinokinase|nr:galactokinase family protein [Pyrinomonadaceae bacterium]